MQDLATVTSLTIMSQNFIMYTYVFFFLYLFYIVKYIIQHLALIFEDKRIYVFLNIVHIFRTEQIPLPRKISEHLNRTLQNFGTSYMCIHRNTKKYVDGLCVDVLLLQYSILTAFNGKKNDQ